MNAANVQVTANAGALPAGLYAGAVIITAAGGQGSPATIPVTLNVSQLPTIQAIYDSWNYTSGIAPGAWVTITGTALAAGPPQTWTVTGSALPTSLGGVTVTFNGLPAALLYASATQVNALIPAGVAPGPVQVIVQSNGIASTAFALPATSTLPAVYAPATPDGSAFYVTAVLTGTSFLVGNNVVDPRVLRAAQPGETLDLYMIGLGATANPAQFITNQNFAGAYAVAAPVAVTIGGETAPLLFAGLTSPGLYLVRITVPSDLPAGPSRIQISAGGAVTRSSLFLMLGPEPTSNLVQNGSFETAIAGSWHFAVDPTTGTAATQQTSATAVDGTSSAEIAVTAAAAHTSASSPCLPCAVQFWQGGISLQEGHVYLLHFWAQANPGRTMNLAMGQNGGSYASYGLSTTLTIGPGWQEYQMYFQSTSTDPAARLTFYFGDQAGNTWLDAVVLVDTTP